MVCRACGQDNPNHAINCVSCGAPLTQGVGPHSAWPAPAPQPAVRSRRSPLVPIIVAVVLIFVIGAGALIYLNRREARRQARYQQLSAQEQAVTTEFQPTEKELNDLMETVGNTPADPVLLRGYAQQTLKVLDTYDEQVNRMIELLDTIDREQVAGSDAERNQIRVLRSVFGLRHQEAGKLREMWTLVLNFDPKSGNVDDFQATIKRLGEEAATLDQKAKDQLATIPQ